jgi:UDP-2,3-diacylglucosamine hydrolase
LFISDLHLDPARPGITELFLRFLREQAADAEALYILGDLFESWVGDDEDGPLADSVRSALRALTDSGVAAFILRGNRDFLIGARFAEDTGLRLLPDPCVVTLHGEPTLLMHGDLLCTDDTAYQAFRDQVHDPAWQEAFLAQPLPARHAFAAKARAASQAHQASLIGTAAESIVDVSAATVETMLARYGIARLIHGHTHRPAMHSLRVAGRSAQRIVLGDWYQQGSVLRASRDGFELSALV